MQILALDTTSRQPSVAVIENGRIGYEGWEDGPSTPASSLPAALMRAVSRAGTSLSAIAAFAVAIGPGSFTGLRIGIATMQGLAVAGNKPLVGVSVLDALAATAGDGTPQPSWGLPYPSSRVVVAWVDAWRGEVYAARYVDDHIAAPAAVGLPEELLTPLAGQSLLFVGDGAVTHRASIEAVLGASAQFARSIAPPLAGTIGSLAAQVLATGARPSPHTIRPMYVRRPDAELARDARAEG